MDDCQLRLTTALHLVCYCISISLCDRFWATKSILTTVAALLTIAVLCCTRYDGFGRMGFSFMESICVTVIVGLAVDYVVHYSISYTQVFNHKDAENESIFMQSFK